MNWLHNMKVSAKLIFLLIVVIVSLSAVGFTGYYYQSESANELDAMYTENLTSLVLLNEMRIHSRAIEVDVFDLMLVTGESEIQQLLREIDERVKNFDRDLARYENAKLTPFEKEKLMECKANMKKYRESRDLVIELVKQNKKGEAYQIFNTNTRTLFNAYNKNLIELAEYNVKEAADSNEKNKVGARQSYLLLVSIIFVSIVAAVALGGFIVKYIIENLKIVTSHLGVIAQGDFSIDVPQEFLKRQDEFGAVANAFDTMQKNTRSLIRQLSQSSEQLAASSEEMSASAEQSSLAATQVALTITDVASGAEAQSKSIDETSATVNAIVLDIKKSVTNTNSVEITTNQAAEAAQAGLGAITSAIEQMENIEKTVSASAVVVAKLGERSQEIGTIVNTIAGIAGQTNLLALNAAIEAARAGEQGRGFAVVAEEVRKLAEQSQEAAKNIADLIREIQVDTEKAVISMNDGTNEVKKGTAVVTTAGNSFNDIAGLVTEVSRQIKEVSSNMQQIANCSQHIVEKVSQIDQVSESTLVHTQTVSAATEEQSASMEEIAASSQSLAKLAEELQAAIQKFKI